MCDLDCELEKDTDLFDSFVITTDTDIQSYGNDSVFNSTYNNFTRLELDDYGNEYEDVYENTYQPIYESFTYTNRINLAGIILICIILYMSIYK